MKMTVKFSTASEHKKITADTTNINKLLIEQHDGYIHLLLSSLFFTNNSNTIQLLLIVVTVQQFLVVSYP